MFLKSHKVTFKNRYMVIGERVTEYLFLPHMHDYYEYIYASKGNTTLLVENEYTELKEGQAFLIFPWQCHSIKGHKKSELCIITFSEDNIQNPEEYIHMNDIVSSPYIPDKNINEAAISKLIDSPCENQITLFGCINLLFSDFLKNNPQNVTDTENGSAQSYTRQVVKSALNYIKTHYDEPITLNEVANAVSVSSNYLSRILNNNNSMGFSEYLNSLRLTHAQMLLRVTDMQISEIARKCSYKSARTFNRQFKDKFGKTPEKSRADFKIKLEKDLFVYQQYKQADAYRREIFQMNKTNFTSKNDCFTLSNGVKIPCIGYGTWQTPSGELTEQCVKTAIDCGYTHIDTAFAYGNEESVGKGIKASGAKREDIFVTTKHWVTERGYDKTIAAVETSLKNLGLDYLDLYLVHWPCVAKVSENWEEINLDTWRAFERMYKDGKIRAIGVSNYQQKHLETLFNNAEIKPMVNQLEFHPGFTQFDNVLYAQKNDMLVEAWSPLGSGAVLGDARLKAIAEKYNKSVAQLCVKFALQCGILPLPKSTNAERITANAEVFDFTIDDEDIKKLIDFPLLGYSGFIPEEAPADALAE